LFLVLQRDSESSVVCPRDLGVNVKAKLFAMYDFTVATTNDNEGVGNIRRRRGDEKSRLWGSAMLIRGAASDYESMIVGLYQAPFRTGSFKAFMR
jgi:hypothetical protein